MKTPDEFIREDFLLRPVRNVDKLVFDGNDVKKLMEDYAAYMLEHSYSLKKLEVERLRETRLNPMFHRPMGASVPGDPWHDHWMQLQAGRRTNSQEELLAKGWEINMGTVGKNEEESE